MIKLRLSKTGRKGVNSFKIVAVHNREKRDTNFVEILGHYSPMTKQVEVKKDRVEYWLGVGAQASNTVNNILVRAGVLKKDSVRGGKFQIQAGKKATERRAKLAEAAESKIQATQAETTPAEAKAEVEPEATAVESQAEAAPVSN